MLLRLVVASFIAVRRTTPSGSALLAAVVATALLSAGQAGATFLGTGVACEAIGVLRTCVPSAGNFFFDTFVVADDNGPLFGMNGGDTTITLVMQDTVTANDLLGTGFRLVGLRTTGGELIEPIVPTDIDFFGNWVSLPATLPVITNNDPTTDVATIEWTTLAGGDPVSFSNAGITINVRFTPVPEPGTALLLGVGLAGLGVIVRSRRQATQTLH